MQQYRQGDVLLIPNPIPDTARPVRRDKGRVVLAYGEVTGHAHAFTGPYVHLFADGARRFLSVDQTTKLRHEEHPAMEVPAGTYSVITQREHDELAAPRVAD